MGRLAKDAPLGDAHKGTGDTMADSGLNLGKAGGSHMGGGKAPTIKSNMKLDGKIAGGGGKSITAGKKGSK
jgi:hypothetical protein